MITYLVNILMCYLHLRVESMICMLERAGVIGLCMNVISMYFSTTVLCECGAIWFSMGSLVNVLIMLNGSSY